MQKIILQEANWPNKKYLEMEFNGEESVVLPLRQQLAWRSQLGNLQLRITTDSQEQP